MKLAPSIAMFLVAMDCFEKAMDVNNQVIFSENAIWLWWIAGASLLIGAIAIWFENK